MTHLTIEKKFSEGHGSISMRPKLDPKCAQAVKQLVKIEGISCFVDGTDSRGDYEGYEFSRTKSEQLDKTIHEIADAVMATGCTVSFGEDAIQGKKAIPKPWATRVVGKVIPHLFHA
jgi:hypothetical protein